MLLPFIVILPGLISLVLMKVDVGYHLPLKPDGRVDYDMTLPSLLSHFYPSGLLGVGLTALMASFMSGMAGNITAFNSVWIYDIYQPIFGKHAPDSHYLKVGKLTTIVGILLSVGTAYLARSFNNIMDLLQLVFGFVNAPLFATFMLGMFWKRATGRGAFVGLISGTLGAALVHGLTEAEGKGGWLVSQPVHQFSSAMAQAFGIAIASWTTCFVVTILVSFSQAPKKDEEMVGLVYSLTPKPAPEKTTLWASPVFLGVLALVVVVIFNLIFY